MLGRVDLSTPRRWRGAQLGHHGHGVCAGSGVLWLVVTSLRARRM